ncbi:phosphagen kinase [Desulfobacula sp.]|uniref:phosphagen kinase n=1 Tax=Desulfobacula sp. TaxID=2593537 RepID=UPI0025BECFBA|nr:phosphagen kinase [Desulfobacula sp.]
MNPPIFPERSNCLVKKYLSLEIFNALEHQKTDSRFTLAQAINSGIKNWDSSIGIYAGDAQSYRTFSLLFDPIICEYHGFSKDKNHKPDISPLMLPSLDPEKKYIKSTRVRVARNLEGFSFPCHISLSQRRKLEKKIISALDRLKDDLKGKYYSFEPIDEKELKQLKKENLWFQKGDRFQDAAGINSDFPKCRGVFHSFDKRFMVWVNEEDHLRVIGLERTSDISSVYNRLSRALSALNQSLAFSRDETYGYLTSCPTNIGTSMRAGVHIQLEKLEQNKDLLHGIVKGYNLQIRGTGGEKTKVENAMFDISNRQRLGISESKIIQNLHAGLLAIIKAEKNLGTP